jgi:hypothetical protein
VDRENKIKTFQVSLPYDYRLRCLRPHHLCRFRAAQQRVIFLDEERGRAMVHKARAWCFLTALGCDLVGWTEIRGLEMAPSVGTDAGAAPRRG